MSGILVIQEAQPDRNQRFFQQTLAAGRRLAELTGQQVIAAGVGDHTTELFLQMQGPPPAAAYAIGHPLLASYTADGFTLAFEQLIRTLEPDYVVLPHSYQTRDFAPRLAARFGQVLVGDVVAIEAGPIFVRQIMQGKLNASYRPMGAGPKFVSVQAGAFRAEGENGGRMDIHEFEPTIEAAQIRTRPGERYRAGGETVDLASAQAIVAVGRGIREQANLKLAEELAQALGAEIGASRPICDAGWLGMERQIGSSGQTVAPRLYVAMGVSGAIQHVVGMKGSGCVVAINKDPDAPIFEAADYGIVGDLFEVVPALTEAVRAAKG